MKKNKTLLVAYLLLPLILSYFLFVKVRGQKFVEDPWYNPGPAQLDPDLDFHKLSKSLLHKVNSKSSSEAEMLLFSASAIKVSDSVASRLTNLNLKSLPQTDFYLVRGIDATQGGSEFQIYIRNKQLWVQSSSIGSYRANTIKQPIVVALDKAPQEVFVTYSLAR